LVSKELIGAYKESDYNVSSSPPFTLKIGQFSVELIDLYKLYGCTTAAYITAYNPYSIEMTDAQNGLVQSGLERELESRSLLFLQGEGNDTKGRWPGEKSVLILGIDYSAAKILAEKYQQNAFVWISIDGIPNLVLI